MGGANFIMTEGGTMGDLYAYGDLWLDENGYIYICLLYTSFAALDP